MTVNVTSSYHFNTSNGTTYEPLTASKIISAVVLLLTFVFGLVGNTLYLWVLWFRMRKTINTTWFFHLILGNLFFTLIIPFATVYFMMKPHWMFGLFMCKFINVFLSLAMFAAVFVLTTISIDRYCLVFHPVWYRNHMNPQNASIICIFWWIIAFLISSPYLVFRQVKDDDKNITICYNDFTSFGKWNEQQLKWSLFSVRLLMGLLIPFAIVAYCYLQIFIKMKKEGLARSSKPYKIIIIAILSFFISWTPYHIWYGMSVEGSVQESILQPLQVLTTCLSCINSCFTPLLYLFVVESFKNMFRKSLFHLIESVLKETFSENK
ncbi:probable G-protein coupled receptor 33 [Pseudophryne corroboree]|uniref:probable G-protein coupled receptor 33 n=1 Tax=Pseudophryne corroboree TaxID=495146 RepID=UPI003081DEE6